jgi:hypothetical protein
MENKGNAVLDPANPWDPVEAFEPAIKAAKSNGAICLPQLQYPGRQCPEFINKNPKSSSDVQLEPCLNKSYGKPTPLTKEEIQNLITRYVWASEVLFKAGADGVIVRFQTSISLNSDQAMHFNLIQLDVFLTFNGLAATRQSRLYHNPVSLPKT